MPRDPAAGARRRVLACLGGAALSLLLPAGPATAKGGAAKFSPWKGGATPPLVLKDAKGKEHDLASYRGKLVLVNVWATWCEPCREEMPSLEELQERYKGRPLAVLTVNMEESDAKVARFLESTLLQGDSLTVLYDRFGLVAKAWKARLLPATFLVGADGRIRSTLLGAVDWTSAPVLAHIDSHMPSAVRR